MADLNRAYQWAINTCNAPNIGYSMTYRNQQTVRGITYYDCSSFIWYALKTGGFEPLGGYPFTTDVMGGVLLAMGFQEMPLTGEWLPGDIVVDVGVHTEMVYTGGTGSGVTMGAKNPNVPLVNQVSISNYTTTSSSWDKLYRFGGGGAVSSGSSAYVIAALAGNAWRESHINPTLNQQGGGAFGLFQWDGSRRDSLQAWLSDNGYGLTDPNGQMQYLLVEGDWQGSFNGISSLDEFMSSTSTDIAALTEAFCSCWERAGVPALQERIDFANKAYSYIIAHANDTSITAWETEPQYYLTEAQALNNAVLMYRFYGGGGGGGGTITTTGTSKFWMYLNPFILV